MSGLRMVPVAGREHPGHGRYPDDERATGAEQPDAEQPASHSPAGEERARPERPEEERPGEDRHTDGRPGGGDPVAAAWTAYLAAARQLDGVRRTAATAAGEQARSVQAAREELTGVSARLTAQHRTLRERGVPAMSLSPSPPELAASTRSMAEGPSAVLAALRTAGGWLADADGVLAARGAFWSTRWRNVLVYGPLSLVVPLLQVLLYLVAGPGVVTVVALVVGLPMPAVAFVAGWFALRRLVVPGPEGRLDRTPRFGALVCLVPAVVTTAGLVLATLAG
ncbi:MULTISPECIES: hypothetical protein [Micromonospora]|uniref:Uncharacterized protein n=1 Tax=Micromonospora yangpuensis TaxID=683228 RepID=A0A1C6VGD2_9ACTN|nr:hypothetical protein [Micromonospora yangpuensis]GGM29998.1 hypothetical protein GCM10012279_56080 [Micromonospora yangpuensis]SCL64950.1 hypothetical protein GA0070617_5613 [Micromonospora yangpuensis]